MGSMASEITSITILYSTVIQAQIKENGKAPRHWPLCGEFTGTGDFPAQRASNAEYVSIRWRHHDICTDHAELHQSVSGHSFYLFSQVAWDRFQQNERGRHACMEYVANNYHAGLCAYCRQTKMVRE